MSPAPSDKTTCEDHTGLARAVNEIRQGRFTPLPGTPPEALRAVTAISSSTGPLIDASFIYKTWRIKNEDQPVSSEDFPSVKPPWPSSFIGWVDEDGHSNVAHLSASEYDDSLPPAARRNFHHAALGLGELPRWLLTITQFAYTDGSSDVPIPAGVVGPLLVVGIPVAEDGAPGPMYVTETSAISDKSWSTWPAITVLGSLSLLNSTNCSIVEAPLSRPLRRTEQRYGVRSHVIQVTTSNRARRGGSRPGEPSTITYPLTSVRGHHAHYGDCCPRFHEPKGLLFGKLTGRVWVPQYARGDESVGHVDQTFMMGASA